VKLRAAIKIAVCSIPACLLLTGCIKYKSRPLSAPVIENQYRARSIDSGGILKYARSTGWQQWPPAVLDLNALAWVAAYYSPDLDISRSQIAISDAALRTARVRINPSLGADTGYNLNPESHALYGGSLGFTIETAGKRGYRILQAERDAEAARLSFAETQWILWSKVRSALIDYSFAERRLNLLQRETDLRTEIAEMLDKRLSVGAASQPEVNVYRIELLRVEAALATAKGDAAQKRVALATAVGIPPQALANGKIEYTGVDNPPANISLALHEVQRAGLLHRIDIRRTLVEYAAADASLKLEIARQYPDIQLTPGYTFEEGFARYSFSSIVSALPVFNRNQGPIYAAEARRQQVEARFRGLQSQAIGEMERALALYGSSLTAWRAESGRLARTEREREQAARRALEVGQGDRFSFALAQLETNTVALAQLDALAQVQVSLGALENSVQQPLKPGIRIPPAAELNTRHEVIH
jgi:cobalt-zinc-cadmium efflux system outer membrane protein